MLNSAAVTILVWCKCGPVVSGDSWTGGQRGQGDSGDTVQLVYGAGADSGVSGIRGSGGLWGQGDRVSGDRGTGSVATGGQLGQGDSGERGTFWPGDRGTVGTPSSLSSTVGF